MTVGAPARMSLLGAALVSLRPRQWVKNLFVFAAVIFSENLFTRLFWLALRGFVIFCALSGAIYLINDVADRHNDRRHPLKRHRPIASGALPIPVGIALASALLVGSLAAS